MLASDECAPAHCQERPPWISDLLTFISNISKKVPSNKLVEGLKKRSETDDTEFTVQAPLSVLSLEESPIPSVWPLQGAVQRAQQYYFPVGKAHKFPPPGMILEAGIYSKPVDNNTLGKLPMLNLQRVFLAWIQAFKMAAEAANISDINDPSLQQWVTHFNNVVMHFTHLGGGSENAQQHEKHILVYKLQESDEKSAEDIGHRTLTRAREPFHDHKSLGKAGSAQDVKSRGHVMTPK